MTRSYKNGIISLLNTKGIAIAHIDFYYLTEGEIKKYYKEFAGQYLNEPF